MERHKPKHLRQDGRQIDWSDGFLDDIRFRMHGENLLNLMDSKPAVAEIAEHFAGDHMPPDALEVARIAHIAELSTHMHLGSNVRRSLQNVFRDRLAEVPHADWHDGDDHSALKYTFGLLRDFPVIADYIKSHESRCLGSGHDDFVDIEGLVGLVEKVNFESIIIKSALDYVNFLELEAKPVLSDQEKAKMSRIVTAIKTVNSPLLALTGFDAFEAEILSKAYAWELEQAQNGFFVEKSIEVFDDLGGRRSIGMNAERFLDGMFDEDDYSHSRVTNEQDTYEMFFTDGTVKFAEDTDEYRVLARLKSIGATAKKIHALYNKTEIRETPMDIIGITIIAENEASMAVCLQGLMKRLSVKDITYRAAPSRTEHIHVKGSLNFLSQFGSEGRHSDLYRNLSVKDEACDNGYEAVKLTMSYNVDGNKIPIEIQVTHEAARIRSRSGLGSHTLFKLTKLAKDAGEATVQNYSDSELLARLQRIAARKQKFDKSSYDTNGESTVRANGLYKEVRGSVRALGNIATY